MLSPEQQKVADKILKLMELGKAGNGATGPEAEAANKMAAKLMEEYALSFADLRTGKPKDGIFIQWDMEMGKEVVQWEGHLANVISRAFDVKVVQQKWPWTLMFCGTATDIDISVYFFKYLRRTVGIKTAKEFKKKADQIEFAYAMVTTIGDRMQDLYKRRNDMMSADSRALMVVKTDGLADFVKQQFPKLTKGQGVRLNGSLAARHAGIEAGHKVNITRPVGHSGQASGRVIGH